VINLFFINKWRPLGALGNTLAWLVTKAKDQVAEREENTPNVLESMGLIAPGLVRNNM